MRGYDRGYVDLDEYEEDGDEREEEFGDERYEDMEGDEYEEEYEEEEEQRPAPPTQEVLEYLEIRQKLKEAARRKLAKEGGSASSRSSASHRSSASNFGSFFGPSQPVIADRVIQERKSLLETQHLRQKMPASRGDSKKGGSGSTMQHKNGVQMRPPRDPVKAKVEKLKSTRDYSFLLSDDADVPASRSDPPRNNADSRSAQVQCKSRDLAMHTERKLSQGHDNRRPAMGTSQTRPQTHLRLKTASSMPMAPRKHMDSMKQPEPRMQMPNSNGNGPGQAATSRDVPQRKPSGDAPLRKPSSLLQKKAPISMEKKSAGVPVDRKLAMDRRASDAGVKNHVHSGQWPPPVKMQPPAMRPKPQQSREITDRYRVLPKQNVSSSRHPQARQIPSRAGADSLRRESDKLRRREDEPYRPKPKARPGRYSDEEDDPETALAEIRKMFRYNPNKYAGMDDEDDRMMEVGFRDIEREEARSARIAKEEDLRELKLIQEEEERERRMKALKKRKMAQR